MAMKDKNCWEFITPTDPFKADSMINLRYLNENEAGESGFIGLSPDGNSFVLGNGKPVRFWAVNTDIRDKSMEELEKHAKFLAKLGVNMVRLHGSMNPKGKGTSITDVDEEAIDNAWKLVAAMKKEGIYCTISPYWPHNGHMGGYIPEEWGIEGYSGETDGLWGLLFFNKKLQEGYKVWVRELYTRINPYTGIPLAKDPAVAIIQVQNEDSLLFWTVDSMLPPQKKLLSAEFWKWAIARYGSVKAVMTAWENNIHKDDDFDAGLVGLHSLWEVMEGQKHGKVSRFSDQIEFYSEKMYSFHKMIGDYYRNELGCKQLINANNWRPADLVKLNDAERWSYTANEVLAVNRYFGGIHTGKGDGTVAGAGHFYTDGSVLLDPRALPVNLKQVEGHPLMVTESTWVCPVSYQSEGPLLIAAYQSLTGVSTFYWFIAISTYFDEKPHMKEFAEEGEEWPICEWVLSTPSLMGSFPAASLIYRNAYIRQGEPVVQEERPLEDLWATTGTVIAEDQSYDPNRDKGDAGTKSDVDSGVDPYAFLVGPVKVKYGSEHAESRHKELSEYIDYGRKLVRSITGEIETDYGIGICTVDAPRAQGATGFFNKKGKIELSDFIIDSDNEYATVMLVPMDDQTISLSSKLLLQVTTKCHPAGWETQEAEFTGRDGKTVYKGREIISAGKMPWVIENTSMTVTVKNSGISKAVLLDVYGSPSEEVPGESIPEGFRVKLPANTMYMILE